MMIEPIGPLDPIGIVRSSLTDCGEAPMHGDEGAPDAWLHLTAQAAPGLAGIAVDDALLVLTWLHRANRAIITVHPRGDQTRPLTGVFGTRSPDRPNPIGLHRVTVREIAGSALRVGPLEAIDGTPIIDIKPLLSGDMAER